MCYSISMAATNTSMIRILVLRHGDTSKEFGCMGRKGKRQHVKLASMYLMTRACPRAPNLEQLMGQG